MTSSPKPFIRHRIAGAAVATAALVTTVSGTASASDLQKTESKSAVVLLTPTTAPIKLGSSAWYSLNWTADDAQVRDFKVLITTDRPTIGVSYPENTATYTSLYRDDVLSEEELDYTAFKLTVPAGTPGIVKITATVTYKTGSTANPTSVTRTFPVTAVAQ